MFTIDNGLSDLLKYNLYITKEITSNEMYVNVFF